VSDELMVLLRPLATYRRLVQEPGGPAWVRPLWFAVLCGCGASMATSGRVTLRLPMPVTIYAALIPLLEIAVLRVLLGPKIARAVDLFFMGHATWSLWLLTLAGIFAFADPIQAYRLTGPPWGLVSVGLVMAWSGYTDWCFFRCVSPERTGRNLAVQRVVCWTVGLAIFGGGSLWPGLLGIVWR
jgi:hypothetical protein